MSPEVLKQVSEALHQVNEYVRFSEATDAEVKFVVGKLDEADTLIRAALLAAEQAKAPFDVVAHLTRQRAWSEKTFGPGRRTKGVIDHIRKELTEIEADPTDLSEWIDVVILAFDGAWRAGWEPEQTVEAIAAKQAKNESRNWPDWRTVSQDHAIEHDRSAEPAKAPPDRERLARQLEGRRPRDGSADDQLYAEAAAALRLPAPEEVEEMAIRLDHYSLLSWDDQETFRKDLAALLRRLSPVTAGEWSTADLRAEIGRLQEILHHRVLGDPRVGVSSFPPSPKEAGR